MVWTKPILSTKILKKKRKACSTRITRTCPLALSLLSWYSESFLYGATILTTTRSSALTDAMIGLFYDHVSEKDRQVVEILGFTTGKVREFIYKFVPDKNIKDQIWNHVHENGNLLSLCYIPVNCFIVCYTLMAKIMLNSREAQNTPRTLPNTLTNIYEIALNRFLLNHHAFYKNVKASRRRECDNFQFSKPVNETLQKLGKIAKKGLEEGKLIFSKKDITHVAVMKKIQKIVSVMKH